MIRMKAKQFYFIFTFIIVSSTGFSQTVDSTRIIQHFSGTASITNNGISLIPSFSLGKPAVLILMSLGGFIVPDPPGFDDVQFLGFLPGATHVYEFGFIVKECSQLVYILVGHPLPFLPGEINDFLLGIDVAGCRRNVIGRGTGDAGNQE